MGRMTTSSPWLTAIWFLVILALIPVALWLLKRSPLHSLQQQQQRGGVKVVGATFVGPGQRLLTVEVGTGEHRRWLLLGATAQQINFIQELTPGETPPPPPLPPFAQLLKRHLQRGDRP